MCFVCWEFWTFNAYQLNSSYQIWVEFVCVYQKSLKQKFKTGFWVYVLVLWIHKGYCVVKKLVWNVCIKAFWYTKVLKFNILPEKHLYKWLTIDKHYLKKNVITAKFSLSIELLFPLPLNPKIRKEIKWN